MVVERVMAQPIPAEHPALQIQVVALAAAVVAVVVQEDQVVQASSSSPTLALNVAQAAQSHQAVATPFIHLRPLGLLQLN